ncbi:ABC transporter permease [Francisella philomiragia]|uniref:ABC transporter permease n=1 Tax=Francisella philomiragia TaxID=28110 RepID=UPI003513816C
MKYIRFLREIYNSRYLLLSLSKTDLKDRYLNNFFGIVWAFVQPLITIIIMWFVFSVGFRSQPVQGLPFILWLIAAMIPWFFFSEALSSGTNAVLANQYLVKKIVFRVSLLPIVPILSALFIHIFFLFFLFLMFVLYGHYPSIYWLQTIYYSLFAFVLVLGISWFTSSVVIFFRDVGQIVAVLLQFFFWLTPIMWPLSMMPAKYQFIMNLNPCYYIVSGYRDSMINHVWFWDKPLLTLYNIVLLIIFVTLGMSMFRKLKPHFADVL